MKIRSLLLTVGMILIIFLMLPLSAAAQTTSSVIYGYVSMDGVAVNGANVTITCYTSGNGIDQHAVTANDPDSKAGYYSFDINGSGSGYSITASYQGHSATAQQIVSQVSVQVDLNIISVTPTPRPIITITPTPTPRPSGELGGPVKRNNESYFTPMAATNPSPTPIPLMTTTPTPMPTHAATPTLTPTAVPSSGIFSNIYVILVIMLVAIVALAAAALYLWQRY